MARSKAKPIRLRVPPNPQTAARHRRVAIHACLAVLFILGATAGFWFLRGYVDHELAFPAEPPRVVLINCPPTMSQYLRDQISLRVRPAGTHSSFDRQLLVDTAAQLKHNPWIRSVKQIRRVYGNKPGDTIEVDCEYRAPVALVHWGDYYWLVDDEGVKLPDAYSAAQVPRIVIGPDQHVNVRVIEGVRTPPPDFGTKWPGGDLAAGIEMVKLLYGRAYTEEVIKVDVSNFDGRKDPKEAKLVLVTRRGTEVRWGEPVSSVNFELSPAQKLANLDAVYAKTGRVDGGHSWIDVRLEDVVFPSSEEAQASYQH